MKYTDYTPLKCGSFYSVGKFGDNIYALEMLTGACCCPAFYRITQEEFDTFELWDEGQLLEVTGRPEICSGYAGHADFDEEAVRKSTW